MKRTMNVHIVLALGLGLTLALLWLLGMPAGLPAARAASFTVCPAGPPTYGYATIQAAVDAAADGDTIKIAQGVYAIDVQKKIRDSELKTI